MTADPQTLVLAQAMGSILATWLVLGLVFTGIGLLVRRAFGLRRLDAQSCLGSFWMGWAASLALLQIWHLGLKVDALALVLLTALGATGLLWNRAELAQWVRHKVPYRGAWALALLLAAAWVANQALNRPLHLDTGYYHLPSILWVETYPVVPGLANLNSILVYNSSHYQYVAALDVGPWAGRVTHIANGLLLLPLFAQVLLSLSALLRREGKPLYHVFCALLAGALVNHTLGKNTASVAPDLPVFALNVVLYTKVLAFLLNEETSGEETGYDVLFIVFIGFVGITVKVSFGAMGTTAALLGLLVWHLRRPVRDRSQDRKVWVWLGACVAGTILPWMLRGILLSGYPAYPSMALSLPVEWRAPKEFLIEDLHWIHSWARWPRKPWPEVLGNSRWIWPWMRMVYRNNTFDIVLPFGLGLAGWLFSLLTRRRHERGPDRWLGMVGALSAVSLVFWFVQAPDPRLIGASFWIFASSGTTLAIGRLGRFVREAHLGLGLAAALVVVALGPLNWQPLWFAPGPDGGFYPMPHALVKEYVTRSGLVLQVPVKGNDCWLTPLPCTPRPQTGLRLRREEDLGSGFVLDPGEPLVLYPLSEMPRPPS
jgi:hypothetical protein